MDLHGFHPLAENCLCDFSRQLEFMCLKKYFNLLLKNTVHNAVDTLADDRLVWGKRKPMPDTPMKAKKLNNKSCKL